MTINEQLKELLDGKGMKLKELSEKSGVSETTIWRFLNGQPISTSNLEAIAEATDTLLRLVQR